TGRATLFHPRGKAIAFQCGGFAAALGWAGFRNRTPMRKVSATSVPRVGSRCLTERAGAIASQGVPSGGRAIGVVFALRCSFIRGTPSWALKLRHNLFARGVPG